MKAINKKIRLLVAMTLVGSGLMCMMSENPKDYSQNNSELIKLQHRLCDLYSEVAHKPYEHRTVEGLDGKIVNLNTIIHQLFEVKQQNANPNKDCVCEPKVLDDTLYHALRLDLNRQIARLNQTDIGLSDFKDVFRDVKFNFKLFSELDRAQGEISDLASKIEALEKNQDRLREIYSISSMGRSW